MLVASWNEKLAATNNTTMYDSKFTLTKIEPNGYYINNTTSIKMSVKDDLYCWNTAKGASYWLASPSGHMDYWMMMIYYSGEFSCNNKGASSLGVRPVVCLSADIPASIGTEGETDFVI